jgi:hypothetical protein
LFVRTLLAAADAPGARGILGAAPLASPGFTGTPTVPTATAGTASTQATSTAFVAAVIQTLIGMAPAELNTLKEIADRLAADETTAAALATTVAGKLAKASNLADLLDASAARSNLGLAIGTNVQAYDADLAAIAALKTTAYGRALLTLADAAGLTALVSTLGASGTNHARGLVPDPGASAGTTRYLREDGTWATVATGGEGSIPGNVKFASLTSSFSTTSASYVDSGLSVTITPSSTTSRILLIANLNMYASAALGSDIDLFYDGATQVTRRRLNFPGATQRQPVTVSHVHAPATTAAKTYTVRVASDGTNTTTADGGSIASSLVAMEIGA